MPPSCQQRPAQAARLAARARRDQDDVGLPQAQPCPRRVAGLGRVDDEIVLRLALVEPLRAVAAGALAADVIDAAEAGERIDQPAPRAAEGPTASSSGMSASVRGVIRCRSALRSSIREALT